MCIIKNSEKLAVKPMLCKETYSAVFIPDLDPYTEKTKLAEIMGLHRNTLGKWHKWAIIFIPDYKEESKKTPLMSKYQCWVLGEFYRLSLLLKRKKMIWIHLKENHANYNFQQFKNIYKSY